MTRVPAGEKHLAASGQTFCELPNNEMHVYSLGQEFIFSKSKILAGNELLCKFFAKVLSHKNDEKSLAQAHSYRAKKIHGSVNSLFTNP